ncbi:MAG: response regulator transcription factor [Burkholderiales bacterium]|nr:response regulator transcription factor [Burkholderiales bacterium]
MKRQLFITDRSEPLPRWCEAFPAAEILSYSIPGTFIANNVDTAVIWLHVQVESKDLAERIRSVKTMATGCPVVVLSNLPSNEEGLLAFSAGAAGYCNALAIPAVLRQVSMVVEQGGLWVGQDLMQRLFTALTARAAPVQTALKALSAREHQVAQAVARGGTNKEIARAMGITERTVKAHLSAIFEKLGVRDRLQLSLIVNGVETMAPAPHKISA